MARKIQRKEFGAREEYEGKTGREFSEVGSWGIIADRAPRSRVVCTNRCGCGISGGSGNGSGGGGGGGVLT